MAIEIYVADLGIIYTFEKIHEYKKLNNISILK